MHNLDLHNKLVAVAKKVRELEEKHPDLQAELAHLNSILAESGVAGPYHPVGQPPYRKDD